MGVVAVAVVVVVVVAEGEEEEEEENNGCANEYFSLANWNTSSEQSLEDESQYWIVISLKLNLHIYGRYYCTLFIMMN